MIEILIVAVTLILLTASYLAIKNKYVILGLFLILISFCILLYRFMNPPPQKICKFIITVPLSSEIDVLPDSLIEAAYQTEQLLVLEKGFSVLSLKNTFSAILSKETTADSLKAILNADYLLNIALKEGKYILSINGETQSVNSLKALKKLMKNKFNLKSVNTLPGSPELLSYFRNLINREDSLNTKLKNNFLSLNDRYSAISRQDSSKIRNFELNKLLNELPNNSDYWWKKSALKIRILLSLSNYYEAFRLIKAQRAFLENQPEYYYLLSKFSYNRFSEFGYTSKFHIRNLAKEHLGADLNVLAELAETFYLDGFNADAENLYRILVRIYPDKVCYRSQLGIVISRLNRVEEAAEIFKQCIKLDSTDWSLHYHLGLQYFWFDQSKAESEFNKAISKGDTTNSLLFLGRIAYDRKDYLTALSYFRQRAKNETGRNDINWLEALKGIRRSLEQIKIADSLKIKKIEQLKP